MKPARGFRDFWAGLRHPWIAPYLLFCLGGLIVLASLGQAKALREVLASLLLAGFGLGATAWVTRGEGSRPGPSPRPWIGLLLSLGLTVLAILRPEFVVPPILSGPFGELLGNFLWQVVLPAAALLVSGVSWTYLGLAGLTRGWGRWRQLAVILVGAVTLPALARPEVVSACLQGPPQRLVLAIPLAYVYAWWARALPREFLYRQVLQPRLQSLLYRPTAAIVGQALLFGLAGAGRRIAQGEPWPLALLAATLQGSALGLFYGFLRDRTGSLALPVFLHAWVELWEVLPQAMLWLAP